MPRGVQTSRKANETRRRELQMRDSDDQAYGFVSAVLGNGRFTVDLFTDKEEDKREKHQLQCKVRGSMRRREWVNNGDVVLVAKRDFDASKGDIITRYLAHEVALLRRYGEIPLTNVVDTAVDATANDDEIVFEDADADDFFRTI
jgi:translation initiation factor 1A